MNIELKPNTWVAVVYAHPEYDTLDFARDAMNTVRSNADEQGLIPIIVSKYGVELNNGCRVRLLDEDKQDDQSRGYRFDSVYLHPPAVHASWLLKAAVRPV